MNHKDQLLKYSTTIAIALSIALAVFYFRGGFTETDINELRKDISDACFIPAVLFIGFGLLCVASNEGVLDIIGYGFQSLIYLFTPIRKKRDAGGFYEYKMSKKEKRKPVPVHILYVGLLFLVPAIIFTLLYD